MQRLGVEEYWRERRRRNGERLGEKDGGERIAQRFDIVLGLGRG